MPTPFDAPSAVPYSHVRGGHGALAMQVLLLSRLLILSLHFLAVLNVLTDCAFVVSNSLMILPATTTDPRALATYNSKYDA